MLELDRGIQKAYIGLMKPFSWDPEKEAILDPFETELENSFANDSWVEVKDRAERQKAMVAAKATKSERTNIRLSLEDVVGIKKKASEYGLGYQTLIASIIHQYVTGRLVEAGSMHR